MTAAPVPDRPVTAAGPRPAALGLTRAGLVEVGLVLVVLLAVAARHWRHGPTAADDDYAQYVLHAKALIQGRAYWDTGYLYSPRASWVAPLNFPPGLPITLVPLLLIWQWTSPVFELLMLAFLAGFAVAAYRYIRRYSPEPVALGAVLMMAAALLEQNVQGTIGPDLGFAMLAWTTFLVADRPGAWSRGRTLGVTALGVAALLYRLAAAPLIGAVLVLGLIRRREVGLRAAVPLLAWSVAFALLYRFQTYGPAPTRIPPAFSQALARASDHGGLLGEVVATAWHRLSTYRIGVAYSFLAPFDGPAQEVYQILCAALVAIGIAVLGKRLIRTMGGWFAAATVAMVAVANVASHRYLYVLFPFVTWAICAGLGATAGALRGAVRRAPKGLEQLPLAFALGALLLSLRTPPAELQDRSREVLAMRQELFRRLRADPGFRGRRVVFGKPRQLTLETGLPAMGILFARTSDDLLTVLQAEGVTDIVLPKERDSQSSSPLPESGAVERLRQQIRAQADHFPSEMITPDFERFRVLAGPPPAGPEPR